MKAAIFAAVLFLAGCASQLVETTLGPATTPPQQVYRLAGAYRIVLARLEVAPAEAVTPRVRLANTRADGEIKEAYAAVSASNAPAGLAQQINEATTAIGVLAATAKLTDTVQNFPSLDPVGLGGWLLGKLVNAGPIAEVYRAEIDKLNEQLNDMFIAKRDPTQAEWESLWAAVAAGQARLAAR